MLNHGQVYYVLGWIFWAAGGAAKPFDDSGRNSGHGDPTAQIVFGVNIVVIVALVVGWLAPVWRGTLGVQFRPDGIVDRSLLGILTVPWEALAPAYPEVSSASARSLVAHLRPAGTGAPPGPTVSPPDQCGYRRPAIPLRRHRLLCAAIAYYVGYPQCRAEIGTQAGYDRLVHALVGPSPS